MRLVSTANCKSGMIVAKPIYHENGNLLIGKGIALTDQFIKRLQQMGVGLLYVTDKVTEDINIEDSIPVEMRVHATNALKSIFENIHKGKGKKVAEAIRNKSFQKVIKGIVDELLGNRGAVNLLAQIHISDHYVYSHSLNVMIYSMALAIGKGYTGQKLNNIALGCLLHDIGKMSIPSEVLQKPGKLTAEEFEVVKKHTRDGYNLLRQEFDIHLSIAHCALQHHEKWNGTGYPLELKGEDIHPFARIIAIADVFDALTSNRVYRKAMLPHEAMEIIYAESNQSFDPEIVQLFNKKINIYPIGITVKLNTGETGVVVDYNGNLSSRPIVRIFKSPDGEVLKDYVEVDLSKHLSTMIVECETIV